VIPNETYLDMLGQHELEVLDAFDTPATTTNPIVRFLFQEWHRRAHKTTLFVNLAVRESCKYAQSKYVYVAPTKVWARDIAWDDPTMLWAALPSKAEVDWKKNDDKMLITFANGSMLKFGGSDKPDSIRGIDADGVGFDEWSLHKSQIWGEVFRPIIAGAPKPGHRPRWANFMYTPKGFNHATQMFNNAANVESEGLLPTTGAAKNCKPGYFASRLTADKSGIIPREELDLMLQEIIDGTMTQVEYDQEMQCRRVTDEERTLITSSLLDRLNTVNWDSVRITQPTMRKIVAIDPAFGGDQCALKGFHNGRVVDEKQVNWTMTHEVVFEAKEMMRRVGTKNVIIDCIGNGKGVSDGLRIDEMNYNVQSFNSAEKVENSDRYANKKAQAVDFTAQEIRKLQVEPVKDPETRRQLVGLSRYKITTSGKMIMRLNDETKKELGCSPDRGLCYCYGRWGIRKVAPETINEDKRRTHNRSRQSAMSV